MYKRYIITVSECTKLYISYGKISYNFLAYSKLVVCTRGFVRYAVFSKDNIR